MAGPHHATGAPGQIRIGKVEPCLDGGRYPIRRVTGEWVTVRARVAARGRGVLCCAAVFRHEGEECWRFAEMKPGDDGAWGVSFHCTEPGRYFYTVEAWFDAFAEWRLAMAAAIEAGAGLAPLLEAGAGIAREAAGAAIGADAARLSEFAARLESGRDEFSRAALAMDPELEELVSLHGGRRDGVAHDLEYVVLVERPKARFASWYHFFPRSCTSDASRPGKLSDAMARIPAIARMGFDIALLAPIHPIGRTNRKGADGGEEAGPGDPGSPYAVGNELGGHMAIDPGLGTFDDFDLLLAEGRRFGIEIALDLAVQCSPDHPWVREHPDWFVDRSLAARGQHPDERFSDIVPMDFGCADWESLWSAWAEVVLFWCARGVRAFRIDRPHGRPTEFWEWLMAEVRAQFPETIFLAESFTRPSVVRQLARAGFSQCLTYFTWRNSRDELGRHCLEFLPEGEEDFFQSCLFANTPDVLPEYLRSGGRAAFLVRAMLAATMGSCWGIYSGFELCENTARPGTEEYFPSDKFRVVPRDWGRRGNISEFIQRLNRLRRDNPALQSDRWLRLHRTENPDVFFFSKIAPGHAGAILVVVNLNTVEKRSSWLEVPLEELELGENEVFQVHDLVGEVRYLWQGRHCRIEIDPAVVPGHVFTVRRRISREQDFDYFR